MADFLKKNIQRMHSKLAKLSVLIGFNPRLNTPDRQVLEQNILPYFAQATTCQHILFVGCEWFTKFYEKIFTGKNYWTLDFDATKRKYGAKAHICDAFQNVQHHFKDNSLDLIVCNGVFGWGLNAESEIEIAFANAYRCLRDKGILIIGWNDIPERRPMRLEACKSLQKFKPYSMPTLGSTRYKTESKNAHTFDFYIK